MLYFYPPVYRISRIFTLSLANIRDKELSAEALNIKKKSKEEIRKELKQLQKKIIKKYKILPGDTFDFYVYDEPELTYKQLTVMPDGAISIGLIGRVDLYKLTIEEAIKKINNRLKKYLKYPHAVLVPSSIKSASFTILGQVNNPGVYSIGNNTKVTDALALAKGLAWGEDEKGNKIPLANLEHSYVIRNNEFLPVSFTEILNNGNTLHNIPLQEGDYIYIPSKLNQMIYIIGQVETPSFVPYTSDLTLSRCIAFAEGRKEITSSDVAVIVRGNINNPMAYKVNIEDILMGRTRDFKLEANDVIYFPTGGFYDYNLFIQRIIPTFELINLMLGPFGGAIPMTITPGAK